MGTKGGEEPVKRGERRSVFRVPCSVFRIEDSRPPTCT